MNKNIIEVLANPRAISAFISWPEFSFTSFKMISDLRKQNFSPKTVIDVGANVGQFGIACAKLFDACQVYSFEPAPTVFSTLCRNTKNITNIKVFNFALGDTEEIADFYLNAHSHSSSLLPLGQKHLDAFPKAIEMKKITVKVKTLAAIFNELEIEPPVLLKLDVQGFEFPVLQGAVSILESVDFIIMELSYSPLYKGEKPFNEIVKQMEETGFRAIRPVGWLEHPETNEILQMDWLFGNTSNSNESKIIE